MTDRIVTGSRHPTVPALSRPVRRRWNPGHGDHKHRRQAVLTLAIVASVVAAVTVRSVAHESHTATAPRVPGHPSGVSGPGAVAVTGGVASAPTGPPTPASGWHVDLADDFNAPIGAGRGEDNLWYPTQSWNADPSRTVEGDNGYETEEYNADQVHVKDGNLVLSATYQRGVAPATGNGRGQTAANRVQRNYVAGIVTSPTDQPGYRGFNWTPGNGSTWAFEIDCRFPVDTGELFNAWWSSSQGTWVDERDFFEGNNKTSRLDTDWIYHTPNSGGRRSDFYVQNLTFDPSAAMHRYTYVINPNGSWSLYIDGALQTWVGDLGVAPAQSTTDTPMELIMNYALDATTFTSGSRAFVVNSVAVYQDKAHAGASGVGGGVAPGTFVTTEHAEKS